MKKLKWSIIGAAISLIFLAGCGTSKKAVQESDRQQEKPPIATLEQMLQSEEKLSEDSEFTVTFPQEEHPGIRAISAKSKHMKAHTCAYSSRQQLKSRSIEFSEYRGLTEKLKSLRESDFTSSVPEGCKDPYSLRLRVGTQQRIFVGCRGPSSNASVVSKLVRALEFLLFKGSSG